MKQKIFTQKFKLLLVLAFAMLVGQNAWGQTSLSLVGTSATQDFDTGFSAGGTWTDGSTPLSNWYALGGGAAGIPTAYTLNNGGTSGTSGDGSLKSFGITSNTNRALGWIPSITTSDISYFGWRLKNNSGSTIKILEVKWRGQQWRKTNGLTKSLVLGYQIGSSITNLSTGIYTAFSTFTALFSGTGTTASALDGNASGNYTDKTDYITVNLAAGEEIMLRWQDTRTGNSEQLLAVDNVIVTPQNDQIITFNDNLTSKIYGGSTFNLNATSSSGLPITYTSSNLNIATISGSTVTMVGSGKAVITASQAGNASYSPATNVTQEIWVKPKAPTIAVPTNITTTSFDINWNPDNGLNNANTSYKIEIDTDPAFASVDEIYMGLGTNTANTDADGGFTYVPDTKYYYRIYAVTNTLFSAYSQASFIITGPNTQAYNIVATPTFTTSALTFVSGAFNWSNGAATGRVVFLKEGIGAITPPSDNTTYTASTNWSSLGTQLGSSGYYCIYAGSGNSVTVTGLYPGRTYTVQAYEYQGNPGTEMYLTEVGANNPITFVPWPTTTWTNTTPGHAAENWNTPARWDHNTVPTAALHPAVLVYIDGNCQVTNTAESNNLEIKAIHGGVTPILSVNTSNSLNVVGAFTNSGLPSALVVKSGAGVANGSLTWGSGTVQGTVEMYSKAYTDASSYPAKNRWQYFGIPVTSLTLSNTFANSDERVRKYTETSGAGVDANGLWVPEDINHTNIPKLDGTTVMVPVDGYEVVQTNAKTYNFAGTLNHTSVNKSLTYTSGYYQGSQIIANPFTAAVNIAGLTFSGNVENAVYLYNSGSRAEWSSQLANDAGSNPGTYVVSTPLTAGVLGVPANIPSMQGFLVNASNTGSSIGMPLSSLVSNSTAQRARAISEKTATMIDVIGTLSSDRMWIFSDESCTSKFDNGWDGSKILGSALNTQIYGVGEDGNYQINAVNDINNTYLGFQAGQERNLKMIFTHQNMDTKYGNIYLVDLVANKTVNITASGTEYAFNTEATPTAVNRFKIITQLTAVKNPSASSQLKLVSSQSSVIVSNPTNEAGSLVIYNLSGSAMQTVRFDANGLVTIPINLGKGIYAAKATTATQEVTEKLIIR
ncbi:MAG: fibronectin type III domain-containing protein [Paludibacter sp.]